MYIYVTIGSLTRCQSCVECLLGKWGYKETFGMSAVEEEGITFFLNVNCALLSMQDFSDKVITCQEVVGEINNSRQLRRLVVLPYDLEIDAPDNEDIVFGECYWTSLIGVYMFDMRWGDL